MSNVIKLGRTVGRVHVEHRLDDIQSSQPGDGLPGSESGCGAEMSDQPSPAEEYQRGLKQGRAEAEQALREELVKEIAAEQGKIGTLLSSIWEQFSQLYERQEQEIVRCGLAVARAIIKREVAVDKGVIQLQVREALRHLIGVEKVKLRVHPSDEETLRRHRDEISSASDSLREMVIEPDDKIEPGGCILESESGNVDARFSTQLERLEAVLFEVNQQAGGS